MARKEAAPAAVKPAEHFYVCVRSCQARKADGSVLYASDGGPEGIEAATVIVTHKPLPASWTDGKPKTQGVHANPPRWRAMTADEVKQHSWVAETVAEDGPDWR